MDNVTYAPIFTDIKHNGDTDQNKRAFYRITVYYPETFGFPTLFEIIQGFIWDEDAQKTYLLFYGGKAESIREAIKMIDMYSFVGV